MLPVEVLAQIASHLDEQTRLQFSMGHSSLLFATQLEFGGPVTLDLTERTDGEVRAFFGGKFRFGRGQWGARGTENKSNIGRRVIISSDQLSRPAFMALLPRDLELIKIRGENREISAADHLTKLHAFKKMTHLDLSETSIWPKISIKPGIRQVVNLLEPIGELKSLTHLRISVIADTPVGVSRTAVVA